MPIPPADSAAAWRTVLSIVFPKSERAGELERLARRDYSFVTLAEAGYLACEAGTAGRAPGSSYCEQRRDQVLGGDVRRRRQAGQSRLRTAARLRRDIYDRYQHFASRWGADFQPQMSPDRISVFIQRAAVFVANDVRALAAITRSRLPRRSRGRTDRSPRRDQGALLAKPKWHASTRMRVDLSRMDKGGARIGSGQMRGTDMSLELWDPRKPYQTWPEPVLFRPGQRRLYRGDPVQLRNAVRFAGKRNPIQVCNQRMLAGFEGVGYVYDSDAVDGLGASRFSKLRVRGPRDPRRSRRQRAAPQEVSRLSLDRRWVMVRNYMERMARYARTFAREKHRGNRARMRTTHQYWQQARAWAIRDLMGLIPQLVQQSAFLSHEHNRNRRPGRRRNWRVSAATAGRVREAQAEVLDAYMLLTALRSGNRSDLRGLGSCCTPCDQGRPCAGKAVSGLGFNWMPQQHTANRDRPAAELKRTIAPADVTTFSCGIGSPLRLTLRNGNRVLWSEFTRSSQAAVMDDPVLGPGVRIKMARCDQQENDPGVILWAARQREKTAAANALVASQTVAPSFADEFGKSAGSLFAGAGRAVTKGAGAAVLSFLKTAWPVLLGGGVLWWMVGARGRKVAAGYAGRGARRVGTSFRNVGAGVAAKVRGPRDNVTGAEARALQSMVDAQYGLEGVDPPALAEALADRAKVYLGPLHSENCHWSTGAYERRGPRAHQLRAPEKKIDRMIEALGGSVRVLEQGAIAKLYNEIRIAERNRKWGSGSARGQKAYESNMAKRVAKLEALKAAAA